MLLDADDSQLLLVDYQPRLLKVLHRGDEALQRALLLAKVAQLLQVPAWGSEQNPQGLGPNDEAIRAACQLTLSKTHFDACEDGLLEALQPARQRHIPPADSPASQQATQPSAHPITEVVLAGCEAHVCLLQTALGLLRAGLRVWVVGNACGSRRASDHAAAMQRLQRAGATVVTHEMVLFEWLHDCRHPKFREVLGLIKAAPASGTTLTPS